MDNGHIQLCAIKFLSKELLTKITERRNRSSGTETHKRRRRLKLRCINMSESINYDAITCHTENSYLVGKSYILIFRPSVLTRQKKSCPEIFILGCRDFTRSGVFVYTGAKYMQMLSPELTNTIKS